MIIRTSRGKSFDTDRDLTAEERHVLQKLFAWQDAAGSLEQFREKKQDALKMGWNHSGPIKESPALRSIIREMEERVVSRLAGR